MAEDQVAWLSERRLDNIEDKDGGGAERRDDKGRMEDVAKGGVGRHDGLDEKDAAKRSYPSKDPTS